MSTYTTLSSLLANSGVTAGIEVKVTLVAGVAAADIRYYNNDTPSNIVSPGKTTFSLPAYGTYTVYATNGTQTSSKVTVNATQAMQYSVSLAYFRAYIKITSKSGNTVYLQKGGSNVVTPYVSDGTAKTHTVGLTGDYIVYCTDTKGKTSAKKTVAVSAETTYEVAVNTGVTYGVKVAINQSNPESRVTYYSSEGESTSSWPAAGDSAAWLKTDLFSGIFPCVRSESGTIIKRAWTDAANSQSGDEFIAIPKMGYRMTSNSSYNYIEVTTEEGKSGFNYMAHGLNAEGDCDYIYIGRYLAYNSGSKLYSQYGRTPVSSISLTNARNYATARGTGFQLFSFYQMTLLQCLFLIMYKNCDSQTALGRGYTNTSNSSGTSTGGTSGKGACYGTISTTTQVCFLGIEDFWGNYSQWVDGIYCDFSYNILTYYKNLSNTDNGGSGYADKVPSEINSNFFNYPINIQGTNSGGFIAKDGGGSSSTYWPDDSSLYSGYCCRFGGAWGYGADAGAFCVLVSYSASDSCSSLSVRSVFKHLAS